MHPLDTYSSDMVIAILDDDGNIVQKFDGELPVIQVEDIRQDPEQKYDLDNIESFDGEITIWTKRCRGLFDALLGLKTKSAYRYIRWNKRQAEKKRRKKLKGEIV